MNILISGATKGLGEALVLEALKRYSDARIMGFSRSLENVQASQERLNQADPESVSRVTLLQADIGSKSSIAAVLMDFRAKLGEVDVLVNNVGIFDFDKNLSEVPQEDWEISQEDFASKYQGDSEYQKKLKYRSMVQANFLGNRNLIEAVLAESLKSGHNLDLVDVGSIGVLAELIGKPFADTEHYGRTKAHLARHTLALAKLHDFVRVAIVHPGPFEKSAQLIADEFGDTWAINASDVAKHTFDLYDRVQNQEDRVIQGVIASSKHFAMENNHFGDLDALKIPGLAQGHLRNVSEKDSTFLTRKAL
jgi:NAD(P)-dependent dehydrogenase (short-subunit alcohol dehydrogenase family)